MVEAIRADKEHRISLAGERTSYTAERHGGYSPRPLKRVYTNGADSPLESETGVLEQEIQGISPSDYVDKIGALDEDLIAETLIGNITLCEPQHPRKKTRSEIITRLLQLRKSKIKQNRL